MTLYIYNTESNLLVATIHGETNEACESKAENLGYMHRDDVGCTYSPAFGANDGLVEMAEVAEYHAAQVAAIPTLRLITCNGSANVTIQSIEL